MKQLIGNCVSQQGRTNGERTEKLIQHQAVFVHDKRKDPKMKLNKQKLTS